MTNLVGNHPGSLASRTDPGGFYPVSLDLTGKPVLVVGGGRIAARKVRGLVDAGASVTVVAPGIDAAIADLAEHRTVILERRRYLAGEVAGHRLVVTATGDRRVDGAVAADAAAAGVFCNSADDPANCSFILPAVRRNGPVSVAVSTGGSSPALASWLGDRIEQDVLDGVGEMAALLGDARARLQAAGRSTETLDWRGLLAGPFCDLVRSGRIDDARHLLDALIA